MYATETTEQVISVGFTVDVVGTSPVAPIITVEVELVWGTFVTAPVLVALRGWLE